MKNSLKVVLVIIGTLIGAGFASGKEVYIFFNQLRNFSILSPLRAEMYINAFGDAE